MESCAEVSTRAGTPIKRVDSSPIPPPGTIAAAAKAERAGAPLLLAETAMPPTVSGVTVVTPNDKDAMINLLRCLEEEPASAAARSNRAFQVDWDLVKELQVSGNWTGNCSSIATESVDRIPRITLENVRNRMSHLAKKYRLETWSRPKNNLSGRFNKQGGWQAHVLKVHQILAAVLDVVEDDETKSKWSVVSNAFETLSIMAAIQRVQSEQPDESFEQLYHEYLGASESSEETSSEHTRRSGATPTRTGHMPTNLPEGFPVLFVALPSGVWSSMSVSGQRSDNPEDEPSDLPSDFCVWRDIGEGKNSCLLVLDADYLSMAVTSTGRFDAYLWAIFTALLKEAHHNKVLPVVPPELFSGSWEMCQARALHGFRVFRDATGAYRITMPKYEWYVTLLTSGSLRAVQDTFHDLANEIWHAQFSKGDLESSKRLEKLLIALLGHENDMVRSQATVFLNNFYDQHDWQQDFPFLPVVKTVGSEFVVEVQVNDDCDPKGDKVPEGLLLIMAAPSFERSAELEVYSYHKFEWRPADKTLNPGVEKFRRYMQRTPGRYAWTGTIKFGSFPRCGYYDWRVVRCDPAIGSWEVVQSTVSELRQQFESSFSFSMFNKDDRTEEVSFRSRNLWPELGRLADAAAGKGEMGADSAAQFRTLPLQGRFIVHPVGIRQDQFHEVFVDQLGAVIGNDGTILERGSFAKVATHLESIRTTGTTAVFLAGSLARDNGETIYTSSGEQIYERPDASPFAVTCRATPCEMLGGIRGFTDLMKEADRVGIKVLVDSLARVSSSRTHRKYWPHLLHTIDSEGKRIMLYGTDGRSVSFEESCQLNYRKSETWDLLIDDIISWQRRQGVHGIKLDNAHLMPQIMRAADEELNRLDPDGQSHYSPEERLMGDIVLPCSDSNNGFWSSTAADSHWPNPLMVRLCRDVWRQAPMFIVLGDCGTLEENQSRRLGILSRSGVIPQIQTLPETLCRVFGKRIEPSGLVVQGEEAPAAILSEWFERTHEVLPEGAVCLQASCSHSSPLPALLYGRGAWPAVDFLFFSSDIPSTFQGETDGSAFRIDVANVFKTESMASLDTAGATPSEGFKSPSVAHLATAKSLLNLDQAVPQSWTPSPTSRAALLPPNHNIPRMFSRARSLTKFEPVSDLKKLEEAHAEAVGPKFGFDLKKIDAHYIHRRTLRHKYKIFSEGQLFPLQCTDPDGNALRKVFAFCRFNLETGNMVIGTINLSDKPVPAACVSVKFLSRHYFSAGIKSTALFEIWDLFAVDNDFDGSHSKVAQALHSGELLELFRAGGGASEALTLRTLSDILAEPPMLTLGAYGSSCYGLKMLEPGLENKPDTELAVYVSSLTSLERLVAKASATRKETGKVPVAVEIALKSNFIASTIVNAISIEGDVNAFGDAIEKVAAAAQWRNETAKQLAESDSKVDVKIDGLKFFDLVQEAGLLKAHDGEDPDGRAVRFFAKVEKILESPGAKAYEGATAREDTTSVSIYNILRECESANGLGPVAFMTAELGKWSTVGGLGVMVDELSVTLVTDFGQPAIVISPYYDRNRKGERDYLQKDNIQWKFNINVTVGSQNITLGVHEGVIRGVRLFFVHNADIFPCPYPDLQPHEAVRQLAVIGKCFLEVLCHVSVIPQIVVTNDWTSGLIPAYAKNGFFGDAFKNTTFMHIIHNGDSAYEGRIFPPGRETFAWIHGLPSDLLVDPLWSQTIINPARCAAMSCDTWGTVSWSYRDDLRGRSGGGASPLAPILNKYPQPYATPNGIPIALREAKLKALQAKNHDEAKGLIQKKYFGFEKPDLTIPIFAFIGRITSQKGVHLILDAAESIIKRYNFRVQILVGGKVTWNDPYSARCGNHMYSLKDRYPWSFYADPNEFFGDGSLVNLGADFGLMPSLFEPGGIVQQEFFVAGTPVIAFKTGGLKDTVFEFDLEKQTGNGFNFAAYNLGDYVFAFERAMRVYQDPVKYAKLRRNARESVVSCEQCAAGWLGEFCRLRRKIMVNPAKVKALKNHLPEWKTQAQDRAEAVRDLMAGLAAERAAREKQLREEKLKKEQEVLRAQQLQAQSQLDQAGDRAVVKVKYSPRTKLRPRSVAISGSFDDWRVRRPLLWDNAQVAYLATIALPIGKHVFKFIVDGDWVCSDEYPQERGQDGIFNNVLNVQCN